MWIKIIYYGWLVAMVQTMMKPQIAVRSYRMTQHCNSKGYEFTAGRESILPLSTWREYHIHTHPPAHPHIVQIHPHPHPHSLHTHTHIHTHTHTSTWRDSPLQVRHHNTTDWWCWMTVKQGRCEKRSTKCYHTTSSTVTPYSPHSHPDHIWYKNSNLTHTHTHT